MTRLASEIWGRFRDQVGSKWGVSPWKVVELVQRVVNEVVKPGG